MSAVATTSFKSIKGGGDNIKAISLDHQQRLFRKKRRTRDFEERREISPSQNNIEMKLLNWKGEWKEKEAQEPKKSLRL